jgi:hypothetical protein
MPPTALNVPLAKVVTRMSACVKASMTAQAGLRPARQRQIVPGVGNVWWSWNTFVMMSDWTRMRKTFPAMDRGDHTRNFPKRKGWLSALPLSALGVAKNDFRLTALRRGDYNTPSLAPDLLMSIPLGADRGRARPPGPHRVRDLPP